jgi:hypothetical protein
MRIPQFVLSALVVASTIPSLPSFAAQGTEAFYLKACQDTGYEMAICTCLAKAYAPVKDVNADALSALMQDFILQGDANPQLADAKRDMTMQKINVSDADLQKAIAVAKTGAKCTQ